MNEIDDVAKEVDKVNGWLMYNEGETLYNLAKNCRGKGVIVEIGSFKGRSTIWLGRGSKRGNKVKIFSIDPHKDNSYEDFRMNIRNTKVDDMIISIVKTSEEASKDFNLPIELIFIDGDHEYDFVKKDFELWFPKVIDGGIMAFHDTIWFIGPARVVKKYLYKSRHLRNVRLVGSITYAEKVNHNSVADRLRSRYYLFFFDIEIFKLRYRFLLENLRIYGRTLELPGPVREIAKKIMKLIEW